MEELLGTYQGDDGQLCYFPHTPRLNSFQYSALMHLSTRAHTTHSTAVNISSSDVIGEDSLSFLRFSLVGPSSPGSQTVGKQSSPTRGDTNKINSMEADVHIYTARPSGLKLKIDETQYKYVRIGMRAPL